MDLHQRFDSEIESPTALKDSKQTMYIMGDPMSPKLHFKAVGQEYLPQERETFYRNTQPSFHLSIEKTERKPAKTRVETPKLGLQSSPKEKLKTEQKADLMKEISNTQEKRPNQLYMVQQRRFRNTANSFVSEQSSSKPESVHNMNKATNKGQGNDDLAEVALRKERENRRAKEKSNSKKNRIQKPYVSPTTRPTFQLTNLTQAYTQGVTKLIEGLPFQQKKLKPIVSASLDLKRNQRTSPVATTAQEMLHNLRYSQDSRPNLARENQLNGQYGILRKSIKVGATTMIPSRADISHQNSGQLHSNRSLSNEFPLQAIKSSIFRVEPAQDYTDLKLDFTSNKIMTEYQSQNLLDSVKNGMPSSVQHAKGKKVRIKGKFAEREQAVFMSTPGMHVPLILPPQQRMQQHSTRAYQVQPHLKLTTDTSTEQHIMGILNSTDYHQLKDHRDSSIHDGSSHDQCTCHSHVVSNRNVHSIQCQQRSGQINIHHPNYRNSTSPKQSYKAALSKSKKKSQQPRNVLSIQLRPLKGKATHLKEYRSMIEQEYGKEKKKQIYDTMYSEINQNSMSVPGSRQTATNQQYIKLNLRSENKPSPYRPKRNQHVKLQTISPRGDIDEKIVKLDGTNAEKMNTTISSFGGFSTLRHSASRWKPNQMTQKQFFLFSPNNLQQSQQLNTRYTDQQEVPMPTVTLGEATTQMIPESSCVNLEIKTDTQKNAQASQQQDVNTNQANQINLGYVGLHEQDKTQAADYFNYLMQDEVTVESQAEIGMPSHSNLPFGRIYSRTSNKSKPSRKTPNLSPSPNQSPKQPSPRPAPRPKRSNIIFSKKVAPGATLPVNVQKVQIKETPSRSGLNNSSMMKIQPSPTPSQLPTEQLNNYNRQIYAEQMEQADKKRDNENVETLVSHTNELANDNVETRGAADESEQEGQVNPLNEYASTDLLALQTDPRLDLFSNPTEVDIVHGNQQASQPRLTDWDYRKKKQVAFTESKEKEQAKPDEKMGPLQRKPIALKNKVNHQQVSSITQINEFYTTQSGTTLPQQFVQKQVIKLPARTSSMSILSKESSIIGQMSMNI